MVLVKWMTRLPHPRRDGLLECAQEEHGTHQCLGCWFSPSLVSLPSSAFCFPFIFLMNHLHQVWAFRAAFGRSSSRRSISIIPISHMQWRKSLAKVTELASGAARTESGLGPAPLSLDCVVSPFPLTRILVRCGRLFAPSLGVLRAALHSLGTV